MDIKNLKYNRELMKNKTRLKRELTMVESELEQQRESCNHLPIYLYKNESMENVCRCLLCREKYTTNELEEPYINAGQYKITLLRRFDEEILLDMLQNRCIKIATENSNLTEDEIIENLNKYLLKEQEKVIAAKRQFLIR